MSKEDRQPVEEYRTQIGFSPQYGKIAFISVASKTFEEWDKMLGICLVRAKEIVEK